MIGHHLWPGRIIRMISLDTAVHSDLGNLASGPNYERVLRLARDGHFAGCLNGPPCETWSAARHLQLSLPGPRPLRSATSPWCLPHRTGKELRQVDTGSELLMNSWKLEASVVTNGGATLMEHPWENDDTSKASVWRTAAHDQLLMALPDAFRHRIDQYLYGAKGVKPTCLRALNLGPPQVAAACLRDGQELWRVRPAVGLKGKDQNGAWMTSSAKEYPSALCRTLLVTLIKGLRCRADTEGFRNPVLVPPAAEQWMRDAWSASYDISRSSFLPDYQEM